MSYNIVWIDWMVIGKDRRTSETTVEEDCDLGKVISDISEQGKVIGMYITSDHVPDSDNYPITQFRNHLEDRLHWCKEYSIKKKKI